MESQVKLGKTRKWSDTLLRKVMPYYSLVIKKKKEEKILIRRSRLSSYDSLSPTNKKDN
jgi:hypothetical protein